MRSSNASLKLGTYRIFLLLAFVIFPLYIYHNPVRWDALYYNYSAFLYILRPYFIVGHIMELIGIAMLVVVGHFVGWAVQAFFSSRDTNLAVTVPIGWGFISLLLFGMALLQILFPLYILVLLLLLTTASTLSVFYIKGIKSITLSPLRHCFSKETIPRDRFALILLLIPVLYAFLSSLMPPTQSDGLRYHLAVPKMYLQNGGFVYIERIAFSNFPFLIEYLYTIPLALGLLSGPKLIHCAYFYFSLMLIYQQGRELAGREAAFYAALVMATIPFVPIFASWSFIEFGLTCYTILAFGFLLRYIQSDENSNIYPSIAGLGIAGGFLLGCKYTALATVGLFGLGVLFFAWKRYKPGRVIRHILLLVCITMIIACPWYIKNWLLLGNPVYPFASSIFPTPNWSEFNATFFSYHAGIKGHLNAIQQSPFFMKVIDFISLPFRITFFPGETWHQPEYFGAWPVGMIGLALSPLLLFLRGWSLRMVLHVLYSAALFFVWAYTYRDTRFLLPSIALAAPMLGLLIQRLSQLGRVPGYLIYCMMIYALLWTTGLMLLYRTEDTNGNPAPWGKYDPWLVVGGEVSETRYLEEFNEFTRHNNQAFHYLLENTDSSETVLLHGIHHPFYCPNDFVGADWFNTDPLMEWSWECDSMEELIAKLREENIHYIVYNFGDVHRPGYFQYYRLFRLPPEVSLPLLRERVDHESMKVNYPEMYQSVFLPRYHQKLRSLEQIHPNVSLLEKLLDGNVLSEVFRFELDPEDEREGIRILKVPKESSQFN